MIITTDLQLFQILKEKFSEKEAEYLVNFIRVEIIKINKDSLKIIKSKENFSRSKEIHSTMLAGRKADSLKWLFYIYWIIILVVISLYFL